MIKRKFNNINSASSFFSSARNQSGQLLLEALVAISIITAIVTIGSQMILTSMRSNKFVNEKNVALGLLEETLEALEGVAFEKWQNIYKPPDGSGNAVSSKGTANHYHVETSNGKWIIVAGDKLLEINGLNYTVFFTIENVSRDLSTKNIESNYMAAREDPSTQKITVSVSWPGADPVTLTQFYSRWRNEACAQTNWAGTTSATTTCPSTLYGTDDGNIDRSGGSLKLNPL